MSEEKQLVYNLAEPDWRVALLNWLGKFLYMKKDTDVIVLHGPKSN